MRCGYYEKCNTKECEYKEVKGFIDYINKKCKSNYYRDTCPDKDSKSRYTCDLCFRDNKNNRTIYVEVKQVILGAGEVGKQNKFLGECSGQKRCIDIVNRSIKSNSISPDVKSFIKNCYVNIPLCELKNNKKEEFEKNFLGFLENLDINCKEHKFEFENISISFGLKDIEIKEKFGDLDNGLLILRDEEDGNTLEHILKRMQDVEELCKSILKNFKETSDKKFPKDDEPKILLNILKLRDGYDVFLNCIILDGFLAKIKKRIKKEKIKTSATEGYLLYYTDSFIESIDSKNIRIIDSNTKSKLVIVPILGKKLNGIKIVEI